MIIISNTLLDRSIYEHFASSVIAAAAIYTVRRRWHVSMVDAWPARLECVTKCATSIVHVCSDLLMTIDTHLNAMMPAAAAALVTPVAAAAAVPTACLVGM